MLFNSHIYILFLLAGCALYWLIAERYRKFFLIILGLVFYAYHDVGYLFLILALSFFTYYIGNILLKGAGSVKGKFIFGFSAITLSLVFFKYANLLLSTINSLGFSFGLLDIVMPLGISFFTFEFIHYLFEIYKGNIKSSNLPAFLSFSLFFPSLVSGPIKRFERFQEQVSTIVFRPKYFYYGVLFIILGYVQKYFIADNFIPLTRELAHPETLKSSFAALKQLYFYSLRIYFDFSGMSHIAIGSGFLFGIVLPQNFNYPYFSANMSDFWRRWHISLSDWVRDYIYIPLGGNRNGFILMACYLLAAMFISGLWHGANWNFAIWGLWQGLGIVLHKIYKKYFRFEIENKRFAFLYKAVCIFLTFNFVTFGWIFFVTSSFSDSMVFFSKIF